ncbi:MAG: CPBP family intramembrane glutamic endopeptidase [Alphaproteobacteria bacterium]
MRERFKSIRHFRLLLAIEFIILCIGLPSTIIIFRLAPFMMLFLWAAAAYCAYQLFYVGHENFARDTWKFHAVNKENMKMILPRWIICCVGMTAFLYFYDPSKMFVMLQERPFGLFLLFIIYPLLSALPQELIFCSFFFHRYKRFFKSERARIIASALVFAYAHVLYINWIAPFFSLIAGLIFAMTYAKTRSLALVTIEHALYGNALFMIGLGWYFWSGAVQP